MKEHVEHERAYAQHYANERERRAEEEKEKAYSEAFSLFMYIYSISSSLLNVVSFIVVF
jgi:hypothetical protein